MMMTYDDHRAQARAMCMTPSSRYASALCPRPQRHWYAINISSSGIGDMSGRQIYLFVYMHAVHTLVQSCEAIPTPGAWEP
jgi:hypothetical protein